MELGDHQCNITTFGFCMFFFFGTIVRFSLYVSIMIQLKLHSLKILNPLLVE